MSDSKSVFSSEQEKDNFFSNSLKNIGKETLTEFYEIFFNKIKDEFNLNLQKSKNESITTVVFFSNTMSPEDIMKQINLNFSKELNDYIEFTLEDNPKSYYKNLILFEHEINNNRLIIRY